MLANASKKGVNKARDTDEYKNKMECILRVL